MSRNKIVFIGAGAIGTSLGNSLVKNPGNDVIIVTIEEEVVDTINNQHINQKYFPAVALNPRLKATLSTCLLYSVDWRRWSSMLSLPGLCERLGRMYRGD